MGRKKQQKSVQRIEWGPKELQKGHCHCESSQVYPMGTIDIIEGGLLSLCIALCLSIFLYLCLSVYLVVCVSVSALINMDGAIVLTFSQVV